MYDVTMLYIPCPIVSNSSSCFIEMICFADHTSTMFFLTLPRNGICTSEDDNNYITIMHVLFLLDVLFPEVY